MVSHRTTCPLEHAITELIAVFTVCEMEVYTRFVLKREWSKTFKTRIDVLVYLCLNSLQSFKIPTEKNLVRFTPIANSAKINAVTLKSNCFTSFRAKTYIQGYC